jgi:hypothetical protein
MKTMRWKKIPNIAHLEKNGQDITRMQYVGYIIV